MQRLVNKIKFSYPIELINLKIEKIDCLNETQKDYVNYIKDYKLF